MIHPIKINVSPWILLCEPNMFSLELFVFLCRRRRCCQRLMVSSRLPHNHLA